LANKFKLQIYQNNRTQEVIMSLACTVTLSNLNGISLKVTYSSRLTRMFSSGM